MKITQSRPTRFRALVWTFCGTSFWLNRGVLVCLVGVALFASLVEEIRAQADSSYMEMIEDGLRLERLTGMPVSLPTVGWGAFWASSIAIACVCGPRLDLGRYFYLPIGTRTLAAWYLLPGLLFAAATSAILSPQFARLEIPEFGTWTFFFTTLMFTSAIQILWLTLQRQSLINALLIIAALVVVVVIARSSFRDFPSVYVAWIPRLGPLAIAYFIVSSFTTIRHHRHSAFDAEPEPRSFRLPQFRRRRGPFANAASAQSWFEWRTRGWIPPIGLCAGFAVSWFINHRIDNAFLGSDIDFWHYYSEAEIAKHLSTDFGRFIVVGTVIGGIIGAFSSAPPAQDAYELRLPCNHQFLWRAWGHAWMRNVLISAAVIGLVVVGLYVSMLRPDVRIPSYGEGATLVSNVGFAVVYLVAPLVLFAAISFGAIHAKGCWPWMAVLFCAASLAMSLFALDGESKNASLFLLILIGPLLILNANNVYRLTVEGRNTGTLKRINIIQFAIFGTVAFILYFILLRRFPALNPFQTMLFRTSSAPIVDCLLAMLVAIVAASPFIAVPFTIHQNRHED